MIKRLFSYLILGAFLPLSAFAAAEGAPFHQNPIFWLGICFVIFVFLMIQRGAPAILNMLDEKAKEVTKRLDEARALKEKAQEMHAQAERARHEALLEAEKIIAYAKKDAENFTFESKKKLEKNLIKRRQMAENRIALAEKKALKEIAAQTAKLALAKTHEILDERYTDQLDDHLIDQTIDQIPDLLSTRK